MESRPKVCFVIVGEDSYPPGGGGLAVSAQRICEYLVSDGFKVHVVTGCLEEFGSSIKQEDEITVHRLAEHDNGVETLFGFQRYIRQLDSEEHFHIFDSFFLPSVPPVTAVAGKTRPFIASIRGSDAVMCMTNPFLRPMVLPALKKQNCWVTSVNQAYLDFVGEHVPIEGHSSVLRNAAPPVNRQWRLTGENFGVIGSSGQFRKVKDVPLLVRAYRRLSPQYRRRLLLVGDFREPTEERWSRTLLEEGNVLHELEVTGFLPHAEAKEELMRMHVYVQSSSAEGMPNALLEAAAAGVPIVATAVGGVKEIFTHGHDAMLVESADPTGLARAIERVIENSNLALHLADNAAKLCEHYSREREKDAWVTLHRDLIGTAVESVSTARVAL
jgi:glycosyltransferase involved in cell wall biosynthesis